VVEIRILGPLEVVDADRGRLALPRGRARRLLAMLVVDAGGVMPTDRLLEDLWRGAPPPTASKALHGLISKLRKALAASLEGDTPLDAVIETHPTGYRLAVDPEQIDAERFRRLVAEADALDARQRATALQHALDLWRGPALEEFAHEPFAQAAIASLEQARLAADERRIASELDAGRHAEVTGDLEALIAEHPFREELWAQFMLALYRSGRQAEALKAYKNARKTLIDELGVEPSPTLQRLERAILAHDPALELDAGPNSRTTPVGSTQVGSVPASRSWLEETRQVVTVVFAEIEVIAAGRSVPEGLEDAEAVRPLLRRVHRIASDTIARHGGSVEGFIGGILVAVFGVPEAREDDAWRAVRAAVQLRDELDALGSDPAVTAEVVTRGGINSGEVVLGRPGIGQAAAAGRTVNLASRLQRQASHGELLLSEATHRLLGDALVAEPTDIEHDAHKQLRGWRLVDVQRDSPPAFIRNDAPIVGRDRELAELRELLTTVAQQRKAGLCTVVGEAGIGKSRLALEFTESVEGGVRILTGRCRTYGEGVTFWPLRDLLADVVDGEPTLEAIATLMGGGVEGDVAAGALANAIGVDGERGPRTPLLTATQRLFTELASKGPLVVLLEDIHSAEATFLDLVSGLRQSVTGPVLLLCLARSELLEERRTWPTSGERVRLLELGPLARDESELLLARRLEGRTLPRGTSGPIVDLGQGNPLFLEQLTSALIETERAPSTTAGVGAGAGEPMPLPPSLRTLLVARMMRLGPAERDVLRTAAVVGVRFATDLLEPLIPETSRPFLASHLNALIDRNFLQRVSRSRPAGRSFEYEFVHALVRQAAYHSLTHADRAELHERIAELLLDRDEPDELVGYHLERAYHEARTCGIGLTSLSELSERAGTRLAAAGLRAFGRLDYGGAENLLSRARTLLSPRHPLRTQVLRSLIAVSPAMGRFDSAEAAVGELLDELPRDATDERRRVRLERLRLRMIKGPDPWRHKAFLTVGHQVLEDAVEVGDHVAASQAYYLLSFVHWREGHIADLERTAAAAVRYAGMSGDTRELTGALWWPPRALVEGPARVEDALAACEQLLAEQHHPGVMMNIAALRAMADEFDAARELSDQARKEFSERLHVKRALSYVALRRAYIEILAGELEAAEAVLRDSIDNTLEVGERDMIARIGAALAWLTARREAVEDAETFLTLAEEHLPAQSVEARVRIAIARARLAGLLGDHQVRRLHALVINTPRDLLPLHADLHVELGTALVAAGATKSAIAAFDQAARTHERKGNIAGRRQVEGLRARAQFAADDMDGEQVKVQTSQAP
jgi:DNA-binding SARP family transcriptional activator